MLAPGASPARSQPWSLSLTKRWAPWRWAAVFRVVAPGWGRGRSSDLPRRLSTEAGNLDGKALFT